WGTDCGGADCDNIVWGTSALGFDDNIVWGTAELVENIVWGTSGDVDNIVWGTSSDHDNMTWGNSGEDAPLFDDPNAAPANFDQTVWESIFPLDTPVTSPLEPVADGLPGGGL
ncbi:MAG: hypothetical protein ACREIT_11210, partial [Tepidisphaeraceae bacterium]